ncbi:hypothetical protein FK220_005070 [Flavobacteriaceae bacterium TP-CH-4]|uniref:Uncharacterized protein n=1 Tax=Pelagihabitans pacificus TaxID=2696054 RepID=A0A967E614_9FLAO|nr:hypothetical protein [Pelagihabitans pacificus]NHF58699.1 hypothetical protein [Pelagihabitans pacificus]
MKNSTVAQAVNTQQKIQLVDGTFTISEANDVVTALINEKINFHKLQRLSLCEGLATADTLYPDGRIAELEQEKKIAKAFFKEVRNTGATIKINGTLEISVEK